MLGRHASLQDLPLLQDWARQGWPAIIRRRIPGDEPGTIPAALPLPPCYGKRRVGFSLACDTKIAAIPPVTLTEAAIVAPAAWRPAISALLALGHELGITPRVFGALLWQHMTGLAYLTARSDLDLLWRVHTEANATRLLAGLLRIDSMSPVRIDGELELPDGTAVNWRELAACGAPSQACVLVKSMDLVTIRRADRLFEPVPCSV